jgi:hypothetical protein
MNETNEQPQEMAKPQIGTGKKALFDSGVAYMQRAMARNSEQLAKNNELRAIEIRLDGAKLELQKYEAKVAEEIAAEKDPESGKPLHTNEGKRESARVKRFSEDKQYQMTYDAVKSNEKRKVELMNELQYVINDMKQCQILGEACMRMAATPSTSIILKGGAEE